MERKSLSFWLQKEANKRPSDLVMPIYQSRRTTQPEKKSYCARSGGIKGKSSKLSANYWSAKCGTVNYGKRIIRKYSC